MTKVEHKASGVWLRSSVACPIESYPVLLLVFQIEIMPVTRRGLIKQLDEALAFLNYEGDLESLDLSSLCLLYKRNANKTMHTPEIWPDINKNAFVVIKELLLPRDNVVQMMYADVIEQAKISIDFQGLQSSCHSKFFKAMSHKLQTKLAKQSGGEHVMEINKIHIPYNPKGKLLRTPDLQIVAKSCPSSVQLTLDGNGCMIFLLFHLQKVFESFTERLTIKITD